MKITIATVALILSLLGARLTAADSTPTTIPVEQQFEQADIQLAIEQYKKLRRAAFDLAFKLQTETTQSDDQRNQRANMHERLQVLAEKLRETTIKKAAVAVANAR